MNKIEKENRSGGSWRAQTNCGEADPHMFFPTDQATEELAKAICADCVVRVECKDYAERTNQPNGIWGGRNFGVRPETETQSYLYE